MSKKLVKSFNEFINENWAGTFDRFESKPYYEEDGWKKEIKRYVRKVKSNYKPVAVEHNGTEGEGYSVLVKDENSDFQTWVDVWIQGNDVNCDWNAYIFDLKNQKDVSQKELQGDVDIFDYATSEAIYYLEKLGLINNGVGGWYYGSGRGHLRESKEYKKEFKVGKNYEVDVKSASKVLMAQQMPILKRMVKNNGDGKVYIVSVSNSQVEIAGSKNDAIIGTLKIKLKDAEQFIKM